VVTLAAMRCSVAGYAQLVKEVQHVAREVSIKTETPQQISLRFARIREQTRAGGNQLCQRFAELTNGNQGDDRVVGEIALAILPLGIYTHGSPKPIPECGSKPNAGEQLLPYAGENDEAFRQEAYGRLVGCAIVFTSYGAFY
jgi:hypothetical protein